MRTICGSGPWLPELPMPAIRTPVSVSTCVLGLCSPGV